MTTTRIGAALLVAATIAMAGCSSSSSGGSAATDDPPDDDDHDHDHDHDHEHVAGAIRALVSDENGTLRLYDVSDGLTVFTHTFDGIGAAELTGLTTTEDGRFGVISLRGSVDGVRFLDSGVLVEPHGDHVHLEVEPPELLDYALDGGSFGASRVAHVVSRDERISVFFDGEPTLTTSVYAVTAPLSNLTSALPETAQVNAGNIHHGVAVPAEDGALIMSVAEGEGTARTGVRIYEGGTEIAGFPMSCAGLHGYAVIGDHYLFGCSNAQGGVLIANHDHDTEEWTEHQVDFPAGATLGIGSFAAHADLDFALAPWGNQAFIRVHPTADAMLESDVLELPAEACGYALRDDHGEHLLVLTVDGVLRAYDSADWSAGPDLQVLDAFTCSGTVPVLRSVGSYAYLADPITGDLLEIEFHDDELEIHKSIALEGEPRRLTLFRHPAELEDHEH